MGAYKPNIREDLLRQEAIWVVKATALREYRLWLQFSERQHATPK